MSNKRIKNDENKIILSTHYAFNKTFNLIEPFDLAFHGVYYTRSAHLEDMIRDYERAYKLFKEFHSNHVVTIFDKALCMGLILKKYATFGCSDANAPRRVALLNERFVAEVMVAFMHYSEYSVRNKGVGEMIAPTPFDLKGLAQDHEEEIEKRMRELTLLIHSQEYQANEISRVLREIYDLAILYGNGFDEAEFASVRKRIRVKETKAAPRFNYEESLTYQMHQESLKGKYKRR